MHLSLPVFGFGRKNSAQVKLKKNFDSNCLKIDLKMILSFKIFDSLNPSICTDDLILITVTNFGTYAESATKE